MFHLVDLVLNSKSGQVVPGAIIRLFDQDGEQATLYSDDSLTPIDAVSGLTDAAVADETGQYDLWVEEGVYDLRYYVGSSLLRTVQKIALSGIPSFAQTGAGAVSRSQQEKLREVAVSPEDFGAIGDGTTNDSDAFVSALASLASGSVLRGVRAKTYRLNAGLSVPAGVFLEDMTLSFYSSSAIVGVTWQGALAATRTLASAYAVTTFSDGAISAGSKSFQSTATTFTTANIGQRILIAGAGPSGTDLVCLIERYISAHVVTLDVAAWTTVSGASGSFGGVPIHSRAITLTDVSGITAATKLYIQVQSGSTIDYVSQILEVRSVDSGTKTVTVSGALNFPLQLTDTYLISVWTPAVGGGLRRVTMIGTGCTHDSSVGAQPIDTAGQTFEDLLFVDWKGTNPLPSGSSGGLYPYRGLGNTFRNIRCEGSGSHNVSDINISFQTAFSASGLRSSEATGKGPFFQGCNGFSISDVRSEGAAESRGAKFIGCRSFKVDYILSIDASDVGLAIGGNSYDVTIDTVEVHNFQRGDPTNKIGVWGFPDYAPYGVARNVHIGKIISSNADYYGLLPYAPSANWTVDDFYAPEGMAAIYNDAQAAIHRVNGGPPSHTKAQLVAGVNGDGCDPKRHPLGFTAWCSDATGGAIPVVCNGTAFVTMAGGAIP